MFLRYLYASDNLLDVQFLWSKQERKEAEKKSKGFFSKIFDKKEKKDENHDDWAENPGVRRFLLKRRVYPKSAGQEAASTLDKPAQATLFYTIQTEVVLGQVRCAAQIWCVLQLCLARARDG